MKEKHNGFFRFLVATAIVFGLNSSALGDDKDEQLWVSATVSTWKSEDKKTKVILYGELRSQGDGGSGSDIYMGPILRHQVHPNLNVGGAIKFISLEDDGDNRSLQRYELEATPSIYLDGKNRTILLKIRNRLEFFRENEEENSRRSRIRVSLSKKIANNPYIKEIFISDEYFNKYNTHYNKQYRFVPIGIKLKKPANLTLFIMIKRNAKRSDEDSDTSESTNHALGLNFKF